jgi:hypothetical protein
MNRHFVGWSFPVLVGAMPGATPSATKADEPLRQQRPVFRIDPQTGKLASVGSPVSMPSPSRIRVMN